MPGEVIDRPNPPPLPSRLPDNIRELLASPEIVPLEDHDRKSLQKFQRAACYIAAAMIFLRDNELLEASLEPHHVKPRLLGILTPWRVRHIKKLIATWS